MIKMVIVSNKNVFPLKKRPARLSKYLTSTLPLHKLHISVYSRMALYGPLSFPHRILKRCMFKGQDLIKLLIFTVPSSTFLNSTGYFFFSPVPDREEYDDC